MCSECLLWTAITSLPYPHSQYSMFTELKTEFTVLCVCVFVAGCRPIFSRLTCQQASVLQRFKVTVKAEVTVLFLCWCSSFNPMILPHAASLISLSFVSPASPHPTPPWNSVPRDWSGEIAAQMGGVLCCDVRCNLMLCHVSWWAVWCSICCVSYDVMLYTVLCCLCCAVLWLFMMLHAWMGEVLLISVMLYCVMWYYIVT